jgi:hypothetical protein
MSDSCRERQEHVERLFADHCEAVLAYALRRAVRATVEDVAAER